MRIFDPSDAPATVKDLAALRSGVGLTLIRSVPITVTSAALDLTGVFSAEYDTYELWVDRLVSESSGGDLQIQFIASDGVITSGYLTFSTGFNEIGTDYYAYQSMGGSVAFLSIDNSGSTTRSISARAELFVPPAGGAPARPGWAARSWQGYANGANRHTLASGQLDATGKDITGVRLRLGPSNIAPGLSGAPSRVTIFGIRR